MGPVVFALKGRSLLCVCEREKKRERQEGRGKVRETVREKESGNYYGEKSII